MNIVRKLRWVARAAGVVVTLAVSVCLAELRPPAAGIASAHPEATRAGHEVLAAGGNAFDAAVAIAAALAVVEPYSSGLGGGGFWLLHRAADGSEVMIDARERAPLAATRDMYLGQDGEPVPRLSLDGPLAAGIPGTPAALAHVAHSYGRLPLRQSLTPAIRLAREGPAVTARYRVMAQRRQKVLAAFPDAAKIFLDERSVPGEGFRLRQPELAVTLERIAADGQAGFYGGEIARRLVNGVRAAGGIWSLRDLVEYRVVERAPVRGTYGAVRITSAAPPSSGGVVLVEMLNILEGFGLPRLNRVERAHAIIEAMRLAYRDRALYLGDPDFVRVDVKRLLDPDYARGLRRSIGPRASPSAILPEASVPREAANTTHFSVIDRDGNRAAVTLSINGSFGSGFVPRGTGVLLNNEMDDFAMKPGVPNLYGLVGGETNANAIAPGKRPLSSMTPTFLETPEAVVVLGTPGGSRIITMVLLSALDFAAGTGSVRDWVARPRFHHQYLPDRVEYEPGAFTQPELDELARRGHELRLRERGYGDMQIVVWRKRDNRVEAAADPRGEGADIVR